MNRRSRFTLTIVTALVVVTASIALAQSQRDDSTTGSQDMQLPPGWTEADMMACMKAGTPGPQHEFLARSAGDWRTETAMWMAPDTEPMTSEGACTVTPILDGRFIKVEMNGEMPGMGVYSGIGIYGYDNVAQEFQSSWVDNHNTGITTGTGELSSDGTTLTWNFTYNCPLTKEPCVLREIERITGNDTKSITMFGTDPKSGVEYKMMEIKLTRQSDGTHARSDH